ncbi:MAG: hypothetical protein RIB03_04170 [Henriciella sp.]|uniref:hypothetical protein n=1 Tax=Henriciella sp. TaxID=1968823 RepID=UPI00260B0B11|nr:hypothetical protein [Henriciella sp.]
MSVELIGLITIALAGAGLIHSRRMSIIVLCIMGLLQAAAALFLGGANITPGHLSLGFFVLAVLIRRDGLSYAFASMHPPRAGFFLLLLSLWGVFSGYAMPRMFAGEFMIFPLSSDTKFINEVPLFPVSSNFNQSIYFLGGLLTFAFTSSMARTNRLLQAAGTAVVIAAAANIAIAIIDTVTFAVGVPDALSFLRNAEYAQLFSHQFLGIKRVTASFPEASAFAGVAVGLFAYCLRLWRGGVMTKYTGPIALGTLVAILFALSSTGYVALMAYLACVYMRAVTGMEGRIGRSRKIATSRALFVSSGPFVALCVAAAVAVRPDLLDPVVQIFDNSVTSKLGSASGVERMSWNMAGINAFFETWGLGAGLGSVRTSSFLVAVMSNLGIPGLVLFGLFFVRIFRGPEIRHARFADNISIQHAAAARSGCFAMIIGASLSSSAVDLGILFYVQAGIACASLFTRRVPAEDLIREMPAEAFEPPAEPTAAYVRP